MDGRDGGAALGLRGALDEAVLTHAFDLVTEAVHGFAPHGGCHHLEASELHWERVHSALPP